MSFKSKTDWFGLGDLSGLVCTDDADGKTAQTATAMNEKGDIVACEVFGENIAPSNTYKVKCPLTADIELGSVKTHGSGDEAKYVVLNSVSINTSAGGEPQVQASGDQVCKDADICKYKFSISGLSQKRHAQLVFGGFGITGAGCFLTQANYTASCNVGKATKNGECIAADATEGQIQAQITIVQTANVEPTLSADATWKITAPLAITNPDAQYPTWSATLVNYLSSEQ